MTGDFRVGEWLVQPTLNLISRDGTFVRLEPKVMQVLVCLAEQPGVAVPKESLFHAVWPDTFVTDDVLKRSIFELRRTLQDDARAPRIIQTISKRGYRLILPIEPIAPIGPPLLTVSRGRSLQTKSVHRKLGLAGVVVIAVTLAMLGSKLKSTPPVKAVSFVQLTDDSHAKLDPLTTDGARIYTTEFLPGPHAVLVQMPIEGGDPVPFSALFKQPRLFDLSPDGTELLIGNHEEVGRFSLWVLPVAGANPRRVGEVLADDDAEWGSDGQSIIYSNGHNVSVMRKDGAFARKLLTAPGAVSHLRVSPDGRLLRFTVHDVEVDSTSLWEASSLGTDLHPLLPNWNGSPSECCGRWTQDGQYYVFQSKREGGENIWVLPVKSSLLWKRPQEPVQLTFGPLEFSKPLPGYNPRSLFVIGTQHRSEIMRYDMRTREFVPDLFGLSVQGVAFSRDGEWVTYISYPEATLWRSRADGSERLQLTFSPMRVLVPRWSPDGGQIAFMATAPGKPWNIFLVSREGGPLQHLWPEAQNQADPNWSADGNSLVFGALDIDILPLRILDLKSKQISILPGSDGLYSPRWSPDGQLLAAITSRRPYRLMLFDRRIAKWTELVSFEISYPNWSHDGKYIYFLDWHSSRSFMESGRISRVRLSDRGVESIVELKKLGRLTVGTIGGWIGLAPDDSPLLSRDISTQEIYAIRWEAP